MSERVAASLTRLIGEFCRGAFLIQDFPDNLIFSERLLVTRAAAGADEIFKPFEHLICPSSCALMRETRARILAPCILYKLVVSLDYKWSISLSET